MNKVVSGADEAIRDIRRRYDAHVRGLWSVRAA